MGDAAPRSTTPPAHPRTGRLSKAEVRSRVLDRAIAIVQSQGVQVSVTHLQLESLIVEAGVPRSTVYRIWPSRQDFYDDLIATLPGRSLPARLDPDSMKRGDAHLHRNADALTTAEGRRRIFEESLVVAVEANYDNIFASVPWRNFLALASSVDTHHDEETRHAVERALRARQVHFIDNMEKFYRHTFGQLGMRIRPRYGDDYRALSQAIAAFVEGLCVARLVVPETVTGPLAPLDPGSRSLVVTGVMMIIDGFSEPDPDFDPAAARARAGHDRL